MSLVLMGLARRSLVTFVLSNYLTFVDWVDLGSKGVLSLLVHSYDLCLGLYL